MARPDWDSISADQWSDFERKIQTRDYRCEWWVTRSPELQRAMIDRLGITTPLDMLRHLGTGQ